MVKTTVYLDAEVYQQLRMLADRQNRKQAELIREALQRFVDEKLAVEERPDPVGVGAFRSGRSDIARNAERLLQAAARKKRSRG